MKIAKPNSFNENQVKTKYSRRNRIPKRKLLDSLLSKKEHPDNENMSDSINEVDDTDEYDDPFSTLTASEKDYFKSLLDNLEKGNDEDFLNKYSSTDLLKNNNDIQIKLFLKAIDKKFSEDVIDKILCNITNINIDTPFEYSTHDSYVTVCKMRHLWAFKILLILKSAEPLKPLTYIDILGILITYLDEDLFNEWFDVLRETFKELAGCEDKFFQLSLDASVFWGKKTVILKLLDIVYVPIEFIVENILDPQIVKEHFDSCIQGDLTSPTKYITFNYKNLVNPLRRQYVNEMMPIMHIIKSKEFLHLIKHPLITSFMALKWQKISKFLYLSLFFYCFYLFSIVSYIVLTTRNQKEGALTNLTWCFTIIGTGYLIIREAIQLRFQKEYLKNPSNYLELLLIIFSILIITIKSLDKEIVVCGIILIAIEFWILVGNLPISSLSTHMLMLEEVLKTFLKSFSLYGIFIFTFALSFFVLFGTEHKFGNIFKSVVKTMAMVVGELNYEDLNLEGVCSYILILLFIICMTVVLMNLLNGLAVSDIHLIRQQAELNGLICRAKFLNKHDFELFSYNNKKQDPNCWCNYNISGVYLNDTNFSNKIVLPHECLHCYIIRTVHNKCETVIEKITIWQTFGMWIGNRNLMESSIVEAKTIIMSKENNKRVKTNNEKNQLKIQKITLENIKKTAEHMEKKVLNIYQESQINEKNVQNIVSKVSNIENKAKNMENKVKDNYEESLTIKQNVQNIEEQVHNLEQKVKNIAKEQYNIGKNIEKILKIIEK